MPFSRPMPHDKTLLEISGCCEEDTSDLHLKVLHLFSAGYYRHWAVASNELGLLGKLGPSAEALRRDIRRREIPRKTKVLIMDMED